MRKIAQTLQFGGLSVWHADRGTALRPVNTNSSGGIAKGEIGEADGLFVVQGFSDLLADVPREAIQTA